MKRKPQLEAAGLDGVIAGETAVSTLDAGLHYRGYSIDDLARGASFTEVAYLLLYAELPTSEQLADFHAILAEAAELPQAVSQLLQELPLHVSPMDALRSGISALSHFDPQVNELDADATRAKAIRLLTQVPLLIVTRYRLTRGWELVEMDPELSFAGNLLSMLRDELPSADHERALEASLICYADHEFNASTFTARIVTSTGSDWHSAVVAAIGALKGPQHGGAVEDVLGELLSVDSPAAAVKFVRQATRQRRRVSGFGHRVYRDRSDPRADLLKDVCRQLAVTAEQQHLESIAEAIEAAIWSAKQLRPNVDWPTARLYHFLGLEAELFPTFFAAARIAGWGAHVIEQLDNNRLIQPRANYIGPPPRAFTPLRERS